MKPKSTTQKEYSIRILKVLDYINKNLSGELNLEKLSNISCFSQFHFHRIFTAYINESPAEYISRLRLEKAAILLTTYPELSITDVSYKCGFSSSSAFARAFKQYFGCSSTEWRNGGYEEYKNSKKSKTDSKNWKEFTSPEVYFSDAVNTSLNENNGVNVKGEIKELPAMHIAYVVNLEGYNEKIGLAYEKLCRWAGPRGLLNPSTKYLGMSLDNPDITPEDKCRFYACISAPQQIKAEGEIQVMDLPAGRYAVIHFEGCEEEISKAYQYAYSEYIPGAGFQPDDSYCYEIYHNNPGAEKQFNMDICVPVKPM